MQFAAALLAMAYALVGGPLVGFLLGLIGRNDKTEEMHRQQLVNSAVKLSQIDDVTNGHALPPSEEPRANNETVKADIYTAESAVPVVTRAPQPTDPIV